MNKAKRAVWIFSISITLVIIILFAIYLKTASLNLPENTVIFYYGVTCPHCKNVEAYMTEVNISSILSVESKEVYLNKTNADELIKVEKFCKIQKDYYGAVPFAYYNGECYLGDVPIIEFLKQKISEVNE
ncbi:MAG: hypothetical protein Q8L29_04315 [archaeon]|nr:hypothetical protein [archaeon]